MAERGADAGDEPARPRRAARLAERKEPEQKWQAQPVPGQAGLPDAEDAEDAEDADDGAAEREVAGAAPANPPAEPGAPVLPAVPAAAPAPAPPVPPALGGRPAPVAFPPEWWHFPRETGQHKQCRLCADRGRGREGRVTTGVVCERCNVRLCIKPPDGDPRADTCFKIWHLAPDPSLHPRHVDGVADRAHNFKRDRVRYDDTDSEERERFLYALGVSRRKRRRRE